MEMCVFTVMFTTTQNDAQTFVVGQIYGTSFFVMLKGRERKKRLMKKALSFACSTKIRVVNW